LHEDGAEDIGGSYGVLNGQIYADAADGRHGVGGVAEAEESGAGPLGQAVDRYGQQADVFPVAEFTDTIAQERDEAGDLFAEGGEATLADFVGQTELTSQLHVMAEAARRRSEPLEHCLLTGPGGLGKTSIALLLANEMHANIITTTAPTLTQDGMGKLMASLAEGTILFIDEAHRLPRKLEELLYSAMEDGFIDTRSDIGAIRRPVKPFTLLAATTLPGKLSPSFRDRFGYVARMQYYSIDEILCIVQRSAKVLDIDVTADAADEVALRARGIPRVANQLLRRLRDYAEVKGEGGITQEFAVEAMEFWNMDTLGLDTLARSILKIIVTRYRLGPVGSTNLATALGEDASTIQEAEDYLVRLGLLARTPRG